MISRIIGAVVGWREIVAEGDDRVALANYVERYGIRPFSARYYPDRFSLRLSERSSKRLLAECEKRGITVEVSSLHGLLGILYRYRRRYGFFLGALFLIASAFFSRYFIWDVEVTGNEKVPSAQIIDRLEECGVRPGAFIPALDFELAANRFLLDSDDVAWISVNMRSSLAVAEVLERKKPYEIPYAERTRTGAANLVASEDGEIVLAGVTAGKSLVSPGDVVRKGELLAAGEIILRDESVKYEYASGRVFAKVYREITASAEVHGEEKAYTGRSEERKSVKIFGKIKNLFINGGNIYKEYDTIISDKKARVFGAVTLPVTIRTETLREYRTVPVERTGDEAKRLAEASLRVQLAALLRDGELASVERTDLFDGERYTVTERVYLIKDIAEISEIKEEDKKTNDTENDND